MMTKRVIGLLFLASAAVAFADSRIVSPGDASLEALTTALEQGHGGGDLAAVAAERQARLSTLVRTDVARVLRGAVSSPTRSNLPPRVRGFVEEQVELEGALEVLVEDREDGSRLHFSLETDSGDRYALYFVSRPTRLLTGERVRVSGLRVDNAIAIDSGQSDIRRVAGASTSSVEATTALPNTLGEQKTAVILVNFSDNPVQPYTVAYARGLVFTNMSNFFLESSYGQTWLTGDVFGWYTLPLKTTDTCDTSTIASKAGTAATAAGVNLGNYAHHVFVFPTIPCPWGGLGTVGGNPSRAWINKSLPGGLEHELGHNFGLLHSHSLNCGTVTLGTSCTQWEYGDKFDDMGVNVPYHFNSYQKERLGWLNYAASPPLTTVSASGTYSIDVLETVGSAAKALKIPRGATGSYFYLETRKSFGWDGPLSSNDNVINGVIVHLASPSDPDSSDILDMTPNSSLDTYPNDPALTVGQSFTDSLSGVSITTNSVSATGASVTVTLNSPPPPSTCTHVAPVVSLGPSQTAGVAAGTTVSFTLSVTNKDVSPCTASVFSLTSSVPSGWTGALTAASLSVSPGASASTTLKVTSPTSATNASYAASSSAKNSAATTAAASASASYVVSNPPPPSCTHVAPGVTLAQSQTSTVSAGTTVSFTLSVTNKDVSPCTASTFTLTSAVPAAWSGTLTAASLSLAPGASSATTLKITSPTSALNGSYPVSASARNSAATTASASASAPYVVSNPLPGGSGGTFSDDFNRADSSSLGSSWAGVSGSLVVAGNMAKNAAGLTGNHVALVSILSGATETAEADFTSVDNNLGPRFGVILRYKDSKNYYQIYRQTGGSSRLLISKFVNGVETILGTASVANPVKGVAFHIKGQVAGSTLTLDFDGVRKVTTYDSTFSAGMVGILIGNSSSATVQQQADNFNATAQ